MKKQYPVIGLVFGLMISHVNASQATQITKQQVIAINDSFVTGMREKDFSVYEKYLHESTLIYLDFEPGVDNKPVQVKLSEFKMLAQMSMRMTDDIQVDDEVLSVTVDRQNNQVTLVSKSTVTMDMMGTRVTDVSEGTTVFGLINGQIKILSVHSTLLSSTTH
ncbi:nuclear transport factor 2 family protein [Marinicella meishanensis]|uniref:nuclear transport factor 2 family protein n=1 Tax=Marinicella meishanensis TaxID=2873263 RepID=UPI001CC0023F|nr:nuclear transport factor 2 family protein [Marinicella sp. NBU2979]